MSGRAVTVTAEARELPAPGAAAPEWIEVLPAPDARGLIRARDGRTFWLPDPAAQVAQVASHGAPLALD